MCQYHEVSLVDVQYQSVSFEPMTKTSDSTLKLCAFGLLIQIRIESAH